MSPPSVAESNALLSIIQGSGLKPLVGFLPKVPFRCACKRND